MKVIVDGVIKYDRSNFTHCGPIDLLEYSQLEDWRQKLFTLKLIGEYPESQLGYGNLSQRYDYSSWLKTNNPQYLITGTQTGKFPELNGNFYTRVLDVDIENLKITMMGPIEASSEALTHAAIYGHNPNIKAVFHIHSFEIWKGMIEDHADHIPKEIEYGTIEMAKATANCIKKNDFGIFCMHGHEDGIVAYGRNLEEVGNIILRIYQQYFK